MTLSKQAKYNGKFILSRKFDLAHMRHCVLIASSNNTIDDVFSDHYGDMKNCSINGLDFHNVDICVREYLFRILLALVIEARLSISRIPLVLAIHSRYMEF